MACSFELEKNNFIYHALGRWDFRKLWGRRQAESDENAEKVYGVLNPSILFSSAWEFHHKPSLLGTYDSGHRSTFLTSVELSSPVFKANHRLRHEVEEMATFLLRLKRLGYDLTGRSVGGDNNSLHRTDFSCSWTEHPTACKVYMFPLNRIGAVFSTRLHKQQGQFTQIVYKNPS